MARGRLQVLFDAVGLLACRIMPEVPYTNPYREPEKTLPTTPETLPFDPCRWEGIMQALEIKN